MIVWCSPDRRALVVDSDAVLRTNLGSLVTMANTAPVNLAQFPSQDDSYLPTGGESIPGPEKVGFTTLTGERCYPKTYRCDNLEEMEEVKASVER